MWQQCWACPTWLRRGNAKNIPRTAASCRTCFWPQQRPGCEIPCVVQDTVQGELTWGWKCPLWSHGAQLQDCLQGEVSSPERSHLTVPKQDPGHPGLGNAASATGRCCRVPGPPFLPFPQSHPSPCSKILPHHFDYDHGKGVLSSRREVMPLWSHCAPSLCVHHCDS